VVPDGFWIIGSYLAGTVILAQWVTAGASQSRSFEYRPGPEGHFVFTGTQPGMITVSVVEGGSRRDDFMDAPDPFPVRDPDPPRSRRPFSGYPSAY
jgi:hypothetical protein